MPPEELQRHLDPFEPFRICLATGATYDVRHPGLIMVGRRAAIVDFSTHPLHFYDRAVTIALPHIVRIEPLETEGNGPAQEEAH